MNESRLKVAAAYVRQTHPQSKSNDEQIAEIRKAAEKRRIILLDDLIYADENTGTRQHRKGFEALKKAANDGKLRARGVSTLLFWSTDRITRSLRELVSFEAEMARCGIICQSVTAMNAEEVQ